MVAMHTNKTVIQDMFDVGNLSWLQSTLHSDKAPVGQHTDSAATAATSDAVVMVNGALVTVESVLHNLHRSEDERALVEKELKNMELECGVYSELSCNDSVIL